eukprot:TRINITY_DN12367_c0_g1_i16.p1 TRINITY_DN12367_c0_g1~~TRINITY_DN12367_c0_g1_i16.p1  ORF type:complete len:648 (+),score=89.42 TRINITY_DN12367_c0_g1_i16:31-1974(+)
MLSMSDGFASLVAKLLPRWILKDPGFTTGSQLASRQDAWLRLLPPVPGLLKLLHLGRQDEQKYVQDIRATVFLTDGVNATQELMTSPCAIVLVYQSPEGGKELVRHLVLNYASPVVHQLAETALAGREAVARSALRLLHDSAAWDWELPTGFSLSRFSSLTLGPQRLYLVPHRARGSQEAVAKRASLPIVIADREHSLRQRLSDRWLLHDAAVKAEIAHLEGPPESSKKGSHVAESGSATTDELGTALAMWSPAFLRLMLKRPLRDMLGNRLVALSIFFGFPLVDRTDTLNDEFPLKLHVLQAVPPHDEALRHVDIADLMTERASELLARAEDERKPLCVLWSGGIDSTSVVVALLKAHEVIRDSNKALQPLFVLCSEQSIAEYPLFHEEFLLPAQDAGWLQLLWADAARPISAQLDFAKLIYVTGECADQLFGSDLMQSAFPQEQLVEYRRKYGEVNPEREHAVHLASMQHPLGLRAKWEEAFLPCLLEAGVENDPEGWKAWIRPQLEKCPFPIVTSFDLLWWLNFSMKWQSVILRTFHHRDTLSHQDLRSIVHWFSTPRFQQWSMANHDVKFGSLDAWNTYKAPLKRYIRAFTHDDEYFTNKVKAGSLGPVMNSEEKHSAAIDDKLNMLRWGANCLTVGHEMCDI